MKKIFLLLICLFTVACTPEWQEYNVANGNIAFSMPKPLSELQSGQQILKLGEREVVFESLMQSVGEQVYRINYYELVAGEDDAEQLLRDLLVYTQKVLKLPEDSQQQSPHDYRLSNVVAGVGKSNLIKTRILWSQRAHLLVFAYVFNNSDKQLEDADKFLNSVQVP